jgi:2-polyprenyl-3-methyl-5-hydroxy-6-metoxy-1,4-benzoquinol methylase
MEYKLLTWTDEKVQRFWDYESQFPDHYFTFQVGANLAKLIKRYTGKNTTLLDYGSGPGFLIKHLLENRLEVTALEFSADSLQKIKTTYEGQTGFKGAYLIDELEKKNMRFDIITLIEVIEHLDDYYLDLTLKNIQRLLKPGGYLVVTTPNDEVLSKSLICCPETGELFHRWQHIRSWNTVSLSGFMKNAGFKVVDIEETNFNFNSLQKTIRIPAHELKVIFKRKSLKKDTPHLLCVCQLNNI